MQPNYFIVGAPKCGTTTLAYWLSQTPSVFMTTPKEPHFYAPDYRQPAASIQCNDREQYDALFDEVTDQHKAVGEASTHYLWSEVAISSILADAPDAKFVVCLRKPSDMVRSMHEHHLFWALDNIPNLEKAWRLNEVRRTGRKNPPWNPNPAKLDYAKACAVGSQLDRLYRLVPEEQILIVLLEDMSQKPQEVYRQVVEFIGGEPADIDFSRRNVTRRRRSNRVHAMVRGFRHFGKGRVPWRIIDLVHRINESRNTTSSRRASQMTDEFRAELVKFFIPEVEKIEVLIGRDLSHWKN